MLYRIYCWTVATSRHLRCMIDSTATHKQYMCTESSAVRWRLWAPGTRYDLIDQSATQTAAAQLDSTATRKSHVSAGWASLAASTYLSTAHTPDPAPATISALTALTSRKRGVPSLRCRCMARGLSSERRCPVPACQTPVHNSPHKPNTGTKYSQHNPNTGTRRPYTGTKYLVVNKSQIQVQEGQIPVQNSQ